MRGKGAQRFSMSVDVIPSYLWKSEAIAIEEPMRIEDRYPFLIRETLNRR